jgi:hypothetical protein
MRVGFRWIVSKLKGFSCFSGQPAITIPVARDIARFGFELAAEYVRGRQPGDSAPRRRANPNRCGGRGRLRGLEIQLQAGGARRFGRWVDPTSVLEPASLIMVAVGITVVCLRIRNTSASRRTIK